MQCDWKRSGSRHFSKCPKSFKSLLEKARQHDAYWVAKANQDFTEDLFRLMKGRCLEPRKGVSSRLLRKERPDIQKRYWKGVLWSPSYFASSCGGAPISIVRQYIEQQQTPH